MFTFLTFSKVLVHGIPDFDSHLYCVNLYPCVPQAAEEAAQDAEDAEEARRAALTPEEREAEDKAIADAQAEIQEQKDAAEAAFRATPAGKKLAAAEEKQKKLVAAKEKQAAKLRNMTQSMPDVTGKAKVGAGGDNDKSATEKLTSKKKLW